MDYPLKFTFTAVSYTHLDVYKRQHNGGSFDGQGRFRRPDVIRPCLCRVVHFVHLPFHQAGMRPPCQRLHSSGTVSYTHLDVYKRQVQHRAAALAGADLIGGAGRGCAAVVVAFRAVQHRAAALAGADLIGRASRGRTAVVAVSYTHLDVYKRQRLYNPSCAHIRIRLAGRSRYGSCHR